LVWAAPSRQTIHPTTKPPGHFSFRRRQLRFQKIAQARDVGALLRIARAREPIREPGCRATVITICWRCCTRPVHATLYLLATTLVTLRLAHGLRSSFTTLGVVAGRRQRMLRRALASWTALVVLGFALPVFAGVLHWL
jgi:hypothetical protein